MSERTLIIVKPGAVKRGLVGKILARFEDRNLKIAELRMLHASKELVREHYREHEGKPFYDDIVDGLSASPIVCAIIEGPDTVGIVRRMSGATNPVDAAPGTIRGDFALVMSDNVIHTSDSPASAEREIGIWFGGQATPRN